jgi:large subunit ribosomal protein L30
MVEKKLAEKKMAERKIVGKKTADEATARNAPAAIVTTGKAAVAKSGKKVRVTLVRGLIGTRESHRATVRGLGLRRINHTVELEDTPSVRGMINKVNYLVKCEA